MYKSVRYDDDDDDDDMITMIVFYPCTKFEVRWSLLQKIWRIFHISTIGLDTFTFDFSTSKWDHGSPVT